MDLSNNCQFCDECIQITISSLFKKALCRKYSQSQNFFYSQHIQGILGGCKNKISVRYKDYLDLDDEEEYLKKYYTRSRQTNKFISLIQYYKYHQDVSRLFMSPQGNIILHFQQQKRKLLYKKIRLYLNQQDDDSVSDDETQKFFNNDLFKVSFKLLNKLDQSNLDNKLQKRDSKTIVDMKDMLQSVIKQHTQNSLDITQNMSLTNANQFDDYMLNSQKQVHRNSLHFLSNKPPSIQITNQIKTKINTILKNYKMHMSNNNIDQNNFFTLKHFIQSHQKNNNLQDHNDLNYLRDNYGKHEKKKQPLHNIKYQKIYQNSKKNNNNDVRNPFPNIQSLLKCVDSRKTTHILKNSSHKIIKPQTFRENKKYDKTEKQKLGKSQNQDSNINNQHIYSESKQTKDLNQKLNVKQIYGDTSKKKLNQYSKRGIDYQKHRQSQPILQNTSYDKRKVIQTMQQHVQKVKVNSKPIDSESSRQKPITQVQYQKATLQNQHQKATLQSQHQKGIKKSYKPRLNDKKTDRFITDLNEYKIYNFNNNNVVNVFISQKDGLNKSKLLKKSMSPYNKKVLKTKVDDEYQIMNKNMKKTEMGVNLNGGIDIYKRKHSQA